MVIFVWTMKYSIKMHYTNNIFTVKTVLSVKVVKHFNLPIFLTRIKIYLSADYNLPHCYEHYLFYLKFHFHLAVSVASVKKKYLSF